MARQNTVPYAAENVEITISSEKAEPLKFTKAIRAINNELGEYDLSSLFYSNDGITAEYVEYAKAMYAKYHYNHKCFEALKTKDNVRLLKKKNGFKNQEQ